MYLVKETVEGINLFKLQKFIRKIFLLELILQVNTLEKKKIETHSGKQNPQYTFISILVFSCFERKKRTESTFL